MAIPHISVQLISRSAGRSAVAAAAYRSAEKLIDQRLGKTADFSRKQGVVHTEILTPAGAPSWMLNRVELWNGVEAAERRKDAQVAREVQLALPRDLSFDEQLKLLRTYVQTHFVDAGMVADCAVHLDNPNNPHAHIMLTTRSIVGTGDDAAFGPKERSWNAKDKLLSWREGWALEVNRSLERNGIAQRVDHRSYVDQGIALEPTPKIGVGEAHGGRDGRDCIAERLAEHDATVRRNGEAILAEPTIALVGITHQRATFTRANMARYLHTYTADAAQFEACLGAVMASPELVRFEQETPHDDVRYSTREMLAAEQTMLQSATQLASRTQGHAVAFSHVVDACTGMADEPRRAASYALQSTGDIAVIEGYAGAGKSHMLGQARVAWEAAGYRVLGAALSGKAAEGLEISAGIASRSLASWEHSWSKGREPLGAGDVFVVDEAGMVGTRQMQRVLAAAQNAGAKVVLVGDTQQLQAIEAGAPMRALSKAVGHFAMVNIQRQRDSRDSQASVDLAQGRVAEALVHYRRTGAVLAHADQGSVVDAMVDAWDTGRRGHADGSCIMLAYRKVDVTALNDAARARRQAAGELGAPHVLQTAQGKRTFAVGDRLYFLRNERGLGVKNGTLGTITGVRGSSLQVKVDATSTADTGREVAFDTRDYAHIDHGYAATVHKAQGVTVDRAYVMASPHFDRHTSYVALTRHRSGVQLHYSREDFKDPNALSARLSRTQAKDMALDYSASVHANTAMEATLQQVRSVAEAEGRGARDVTTTRAQQEEAQLRAQAARLAALERASHAASREGLHARVDAPHDSTPGRSLERSIEMRPDAPSAPRDTGRDLSAVEQARSRAEAQAKVYAACQARIDAYDTEVRSLQMARNQLHWYAPKDMDYFRSKSAAMAEARAACAQAQRDKDNAAYRAQRQLANEAHYREAHPVRTALGLEEPRHDWAAQRDQIAEAHAKAETRLHAAEQTRDNLPRDPGFVRDCQRQVDASEQAYAKRQQDIAARTAELKARVPDYAVDQRTVQGIDAERAARDARLQQHDDTRQQLTEARTQAHKPPMTLAQAIDQHPAVVQREAACAQAEHQQQAAERQLQRAEATQHAYQQAHPVKAALGLDEGRGRALEQTRDTHAQAERTTMRAQQDVQHTRDAPETQSDAAQQMAAYNAAIEAAREQAQTLHAALVRQAEMHRADQAAKAVEQALERAQQQSRDRGRDWGMER